MRDLETILCEIAGDLFWRPLVIYQMSFHFIPDYFADGTVSWRSLTTLLCLFLSFVPFVYSTLARVTFQLARYG